ncbi:MAG TPA: ABC transporter substrate-binding protein, partial [Roseiflexaceae bacterium]|nr:ABC transporter substrate-binding protein [Roseiflexaceae bacterium]
QDITLVGRITRTADVARRLTDDMRAQLAALTGQLAGATARPRVYWELDATDPAKPYTVGPGSFVDELITLAGGANVFGQGDNPYPQVSAEQVVAADPQVILLANAQYGVTVESVAQRPGWGGLAAVREGRVYPVDADLTTRPGPRIVAGIESIARLLHPELFAQG